MKKSNKCLNKVNKCFMESICNKSSPLQLNIYLSSPIRKGEWDWRKFFMKQFEYSYYPINLINPKSWWDENSSQLVNMDKYAIEHSDFMICYIPHLSAGASMEILYAYEKHIPVIALINEKILSPWHLHHCHKIFLYKNSLFKSKKKILEEFYKSVDSIIKQMEG